MENAEREAPIAEAWTAVYEPHRILLVLVVGFASINAFIVGGIRRRLATLVQLAWALTVFTVTASRQRFPDRVALPMFLGLALVITVGLGLVTARSNAVASMPKRLRRAASALALVASVLVVARISAEQRYDPRTVSDLNIGAIQSLENQLAALDSVDSTGRFIFVGAAVETELISPLDAESPFASGRLLGLGWPTFSPLYEAGKSRMGLSGDLMTALVGQDNVYLVARQDFIGLIERAYSRRRNMDVDFMLLGSLPTGADIYEVREAVGN